jgi:G:T-mismatch repair DNA endonuclease (very short patch repair protein)
MDRSENMRAIRSKDTLPGMAVRSLIHKLAIASACTGKTLRANRIWHSLLDAR